ncbi:uncharacterized protein [Panulirus ornatus]|uniref:uncharacterized protein n=1 Tax=Panulirus ornatus TaxID=150431 RepID=UPI003A87CC63
MNLSTVMLWVWVAGLLPSPEVTSATFSSSDYENTLVEDPLQPVWDRLDNLSGEIVTAFEGKMQKYVSEMKRDMENKFSSLMSQLNVRTSAIDSNIMNTLSNVLNKVAQVNTYLSSWIENFYTVHMRADADEAVQKLELHVDVKVSALENKLIEHINTVLGSLTGVAPAASSRNVTVASEESAVSVTTASAMETRIVSRITGQLTSLESSVAEQLTTLSGTLASKSDDALATFNAHFRKINELLTGTDEDVDHTSTCSTLVDKISELMAAGSPQGSCSNVDSESVSQLTAALGQMRDSRVFLPRDCSDQHWQHPEAPSGIYQTYPTMDPKAPVTVWCDMGEEGGAKEDGGWTVILRRRNTTWGLTSFNRTWSEYRAGFGMPGEGEWWYGLSSLHALTYRQPYEVHFLMHDIERGLFQALYSTFRVEDEAKNYRLIVDGYSGNVSVDALSSMHHGSPFTTPDRDNDEWDEGNCAVSNSGGWWFNACHYATLTAPFPTSSQRSAKTIRWVTDDEDGWLVLDDVTVQIRPANYGQRFQAHAVD